MNGETTKNRIESVVWQACDTFRGAVDPSDYKNYILVMLFLKYVSDVWADKRAEYQDRYKGNAERIQRALARERFLLPEIELLDKKTGKVKEKFLADFDSLYERRDAPSIGELINIVLEHIEDANKAKLENVFRNVDFNSEPNLGQTKERNRRLKNLLGDFRKLDLRPSLLGGRDVIGDMYEYLIARFAAGAGKKAGEFYTPAQVSQLLAELLDAKKGDRVCDPACGSGSLLIRVARHIENDDFFIAGQESNGATWALCKMNMFLHDIDNARIEWCDTINSPRLVEEDRLMKFNIVVANPPFSLDKWGQETAKIDRYSRFHRGVPPKSKGDYAFISHMVEIALEGEGKVGVVAPHGVLFRGGQEGKIRRAFIEENLLEAVIGLPANLFYGTGIPTVILLFNKARPSVEVLRRRLIGKGVKGDALEKQLKEHPERSILFIDASRDYADGKAQNRLRAVDIVKIAKTFRSKATEDKYSYVATFGEVEEANFNLNIPRYVDTFEEEEEIDICSVQKEIDKLEVQLADTRAKMSGHMKELGYGS